MSILVLTTGGTIGALPYEDPSNPPAFSEMPPDRRDLVCEALNGKSFSFAQTRCVSLPPRDSKEIDAGYRDSMLEKIVEMPEKLVLITHGTDRILGTAAYFYQHYKTVPGLANKAIILTGAMVPLANGPASDGFLNLEFSLRKLMEFENAAESGRRALCRTYIVLCDHDVTGNWAPHLYPYAPGRYEKIYTADSRYNKIQETAA
ncbi:MAG: asparaginase domain-containing protein [Bdellovibrionales bacterium]